MQSPPRLRFPSPRAPRRGKRARLGPLGLIAFAVALLFAHVVQLSHHLLVSHRTCEHGELIHDHSAAPASDLASAERPAKDTRLTLAHDGEGHDHCDANAVRHRLTSADPWVAEAMLLARIDAPALAPEPERRPIALLDFAPKASPPRG
jgi:hypothetical protein